MYLTPFILLFEYVEISASNVLSGRLFLFLFLASVLYDLAPIALKRYVRIDQSPN